MTQPPTSTDRKRVLRKDFWFTCSMMLVVCIFVSALIAMPIWEGNERQSILSANATGTAGVEGTQQAHVTTTAVARITEQAQFNLIDTFDNNDEHWGTDSIDDEYMTGTVSIKEGMYLWNIGEVKQPFIHWENARRGYWFKDYDVYVDSKVAIADGTKSDVCSGFVFRIASFDWERGAYTFSVCNDSYFNVEFYQRGEWENISDWTYSDAIQNYGWNRLGLSAQGDHFTFFINNEIVYEMTDWRATNGGLALFIDVNDEKPASVWFDNFGFRPIEGP